MHSPCPPDGSCRLLGGGPLAMSLDRRTLEATVPLGEKTMDVPRDGLFELRFTEINREPHVVNRRIGSEPKVAGGEFLEGLGKGPSGDGDISLVGLPHLADFRAARIAMKRHVRIRIVQVRFRQVAHLQSFYPPPNGPGISCGAQRSPQHAVVRQRNGRYAGWERPHVRS